MEARPVARAPSGSTFRTEFGVYTARPLPAKPSQADAVPRVNTLTAPMPRHVVKFEMVSSPQKEDLVNYLTNFDSPEKKAALRMISRPGGATIEEIAASTGMPVPVARSAVEVLLKERRVAEEKGILAALRSTRYVVPRVDLKKERRDQHEPENLSDTPANLQAYLDSL